MSLRKMFEAYNFVKYLFGANAFVKYVFEAYKFVKYFFEAHNFSKYLQTLIDFCNENNVTLLRTVGVMFADTEKRVSDYVN